MQKWAIVLRYILYVLNLIRLYFLIISTTESHVARTGDNRQTNCHFLEIVGSKM